MEGDNGSFKMDYKCFKKATKIRLCVEAGMRNALFTEMQETNMHNKKSILFHIWWDRKGIPYFELFIPSDQ